MIVREPPYDLVALFADLEMQKLFEALIERGQEPARRCVREIRWRSVRDPRRDTVWQEPDRALRPFFNREARFLVVWDHHGAGGGSREAADMEQHVVRQLASSGVPAEWTCAVAVEPELETLFQPVWERVKRIVSSERNIEPPDDEAIYRRMSRSTKGSGAPETETADLLREKPKEMFHALVGLARLRRAAPLYEKIGEEVSLPGLKNGSTAARIVETLRDWFPWSDA